MRLDDTIAAIATPLMPSGIGVIRVSGKNSIKLVENLFKGNSIKKTESHKFLYGSIQDQGKLIDKVLVVVMKEPNSYTSENVVEIHCHGSPFVLRKILELVLKGGARLAESGEFTQRAFLKGRLDLTQVEAISDLINANSDMGAQIAANQLNGELFNAIDNIRQKIVSTASLVEAKIEFPDELNEFSHKENCIHRLEKIFYNLKKLISNAEFGQKIRKGFSVALIGKPNVGKSSLLNLLLREERAIVTEIPGTTRDFIEEFIQIKGVPFRIIDTAGIRKSEDIIELEGIRRTQIVKDKADFILLILDANDDLNKEDLISINEIEKNKTLLVINKMDLKKSNLPSWYNSIKDYDHIFISAKSGKGLVQLESILYKEATLGINFKEDEIWITNRRQLQSAKNALIFLKRARKVLKDNRGEEFLAMDLKSCLNALGEIVGETTPDDILEQIFSEFCIGK